MVCTSSTSSTLIVNGYMMYWRIRITSHLCPATFTIPLLPKKWQSLKNNDVKIITSKFHYFQFCCTQLQEELSLKHYSIISVMERNRALCRSLFVAGDDDGDDDDDSKLHWSLNQRHVSSKYNKLELWHCYKNEGDTCESLDLSHIISD